MQTRKWFHRFELVPGLWSPGRLTVNAKAALTQHGFPENLSGKRVIDIGALDGAYSFEFARRGASVLSIDLQDPDRTGFNLAKAAKASLAEYRIMSVYDLSPETVGKFDVAWYWGVFYHLREPLLAFRNIYRVLNEEGLLNFEGAVLDYAWNPEPLLKSRERELRAVQDLPLAFFAGESYAGDWSNWYVPNTTCLRDWLKASGFKDIKINVNQAHSRAVGTAIKDSAFGDKEYPKY